MRRLRALLILGGLLLAALPVVSPADTLSVGQLFFLPQYSVGLNAAMVGNLTGSTVGCGVSGPAYSVCDDLSFGNTTLVATLSGGGTITLTPDNTITSGAYVFPSGYFDVYGADPINIPPEDPVQAFLFDPSNAIVSLQFTGTLINNTNPGNNCYNTTGTQFCSNGQFSADLVINYNNVANLGFDQADIVTEGSPVTVTPEPATFWLMLLPVAMLAFGLGRGRMRAFSRAA